LIPTLGRALAVIERTLTMIATACLFVIMGLVVADVFMRYVLNRPFSFTYDLIGVYLLAAVFFLTLSDASRMSASTFCHSIFLRRGVGSPRS
jgi:TRAP-type C4-dicarboxylate transport system permease small subunit